MAGPIGGPIELKAQNSMQEFKSLSSLLPSMDMQPEPEDEDSEEDNPFANEDEDMKEDKPRW